MMRRPPTIAVDCRMAGHSGIGNSLLGCLEALLPRCPQWKFVLYGSESSPKLRRFAAANVTIRRFSAPIYSLAEQCAWALDRGPRDLDLLWVPHYNIPLV